MYSPIRPMRALALAVAFMGSVAPSMAQEAKDSPKSEKQAERMSRLPRNWGKLNLSNDQRSKVLAIQQKVRAKLEAKESEIEEMSKALQKKRAELLDLRKSVDDERLTVLTDEQKSKLAMLEKESKEKVKAKKKESPAANSVESAVPASAPKATEKGAPKSAKAGNS